MGSHEQGGGSSGCVSCMRWLIIAINVIIAIGAVAGLIIGFVYRDKVEEKMQDICSSCRSVFIVYMSFFGALLGVSLLGFFAVCTRNIVLRVLYFILLFLVFVALLTACILYILLATNTWSMKGGWDASVGTKDTNLCKMELDLKCSGWQTLCRSTPSALPGKCPQCSQEQQSKIDQFTETCETVTLRTFRDFAKIALPVGFTILLVVLIGMIAACVVRKRNIAAGRDGGSGHKL